MEIPEFTRRTFLQKTALLSTAAIAWPCQGESSSKEPAWFQKTSDYLFSLAREDGGFGWEDQPVSHLTPTFAVIAALRVLNRFVPDPDGVATFVRTHHPTSWKKLEQEHREFDYQQLQSLMWLGADVTELRERILKWKAPVPYLAQYERHQYPVFRFQLAAITCRKLLGIPASEISPEWVSYLLSRRRPNGTFNNTPAADGSDGHLLNTWWGLEALQSIKQSPENMQATIQWIQDCQRDNGGFSWHPTPDRGRSPSISYTWAAVNALKMLGARPRNRQGVITFVQSLRNQDGGFGDRPGWNSNPLATREALESLQLLDALNLQVSPPPRSAASAPLPEDLRVFSMQMEAHGRGSPADAVLLAKELGIHLWGAKNATAEWIAAAQETARRQMAPVTFFSAREEYGSWIDFPGLGTYSHMSDLGVPADREIGTMPLNQALTWEQFRQQRLAPLQQANGHLNWQFGENEELVRTVLDESVEQGGYAAISTFHFGNPDFTNSEPFLYRYHGQIPYLSLQDAHGSEPWWFADQTTGFRTLFLAHEPTWDAWCHALQQGWVAAVRKDEITQHQLRMHCGHPLARSLFLKRQDEWQWWDHADRKLPAVSIVVITSATPFEFPRPESGVVVRVRCAWTNTPQGIPRSPLSELRSLRVDSLPVTPELFEMRNPGGGRSLDHAFIFRMPDIHPGNHTVEATVWNLTSQQESTSTLQFVV